MIGAALLALVLGAGWAPPVHAATILEQRVDFEIRGDGSVVERQALQVRLDTAADVEDWSHYPVYLDAHRELESATGQVVLPDGERLKVRRRHRDTIDYRGSSFHDSSQFLILELPGVRVGARVEVATEIVESPYYPAASWRLTGGDPIDLLEVTVRGGGDHWRWALEGDDEGLEITPAAAGLRLAGRDLAARGDDPSEWPRLRFAWGPDASWSGVGRWYRDLMADLPRTSAEISARARELRRDDPRQSLEAFARFVQEEVRYVAVEVGIGGFRPSPPPETLERRWGDCKDKALLLIELLDEVGIAARPALVLASRERRVDPDFPTPTQFNHLIVAVPLAGLAVSEDDAIAGGYLFVDGTQPRGGAHWLSPAVQGQHALVVSPEGGELVTLPVLPRSEARSMLVNLSVDAAGEAEGGVGLRLSGERALGLTEAVAGSAAGRRDEVVLAALRRALPGAEIGNTGWLAGEEDIPTAELSAAVRWPRLLEGRGERFLLRLPARRSLPDPRRLANRSQPWSALAGEDKTTWHLRLSRDCETPEARETVLENAAGRFVQRILRPHRDRLTVEHETVIHRPWLEGELLQDLQQLAAAEDRALRRSLRLRCVVPAAKSIGD